MRSGDDVMFGNLSSRGHQPDGGGFGGGVREEVIKRAFCRCNY